MMLNTLMPTWFKWLLIAVCLLFAVSTIYNRGVNHERARWVNLNNEKLVKSQAEVLRLETINRELERKATQQAAEIANKWKGVLDANNQIKNKLIADLRAGAKRLSISTQPTSTVCTSGISLTPTNQQKFDSTTRAELSEEASGFLVGLVSEADEAIIESNQVKELLLQCRAHVEALRAQQINNKDKP